jgi:tetratricopeptide (TPR) repeat protein
MTEDLSTEQLIERGREEFGRDRFDVALEHLREVTRRQPKYADIHNLVGLCLSLMEKTEEALASFDRAVELNPQYVEALVNRALTLNDLGRYDEARDSFELAAEADFEQGVGRFPSVLAGRLANKHMEIGDLYAVGGALKDAAKQYRRALRLRPRFADIRNRLGRTLLDLGDTDGAVKELEQTLEINPGFHAARINLGLAWYRMGDLPRAAEEWRKCDAERPGNAQVEGYLKLVARAEGEGQ